EIAQGWKSTGTFPFGRLPRELRDCIYDLAFGRLPTIFKTKGLIVQATHKVRHWGIPKWVLTNKQICSEALSYFGSSRTFNAIDINRVCEFQSECDIIPSPDDPFTTPLVFNSEVLRNITIAREYDQYMGIEDKFMAILNRAHVKDASVELEWQVSRFRDSKDWEEHLGAWIAEWHIKQWDGNLRRVKITI
ncbi:hypothetical protein BKA58DRAFT_461503, partial [Alternaria rosae]|uniref:uncharacterized protein n=1 Tax=Alternaria rosae TaxID=1187941 RepID=UPI001E8EF2BB